MAELTQIYRDRKGQARLVFDSGERLQCPSPVVTQLSLEEGESHRINRLRAEIDQTAAQLLEEKARKYLARYLKTTSQYEEHYIRKGYPPEQVRSLIPTLQEEGYLSDHTVAEEHIRHRMEHKPRGREALVAELVGKGFEYSEARDLVYEQVSGEDERQAARRFCQKNRNLSHHKLGQRLKNRGFPATLIFDLINEFEQGDSM